MRIEKRPLIPAGVLLALIAAHAGQNKSLADIYKSGHVRFVEEIRLDEKTMPSDALFSGPVAIACDVVGNVFVLDFSDNNIKVFDPAGKFVRLVGRKGQGPGEFSMPTSLALSGDRLIVLDMGNERLCALTPSGGLVGSQNRSAYAGRPQKLAALPTGEIVLESEKIYFDDPDRPQDRFLEILTPDLKPVRTIYSQPVLRNKFMRTGGTLFNIIQPYGPDVYWDVTPSGGTVVGYSQKYEIRILDKVGAELAAFSHHYDPVKVTAEAEKRFFDGLTYSDGSGVRRGAPDHIVKNTTFPKFMPAFNALLVDSDGNILVHREPKNQEDVYRFFDAFDPAGTFMAMVRVEGDLLFPAASRCSRVFDGRFWLVRTGADDLPYVARYRISE